ncbi:mutator family transposase [Actinomadura pelletieri DSM 43383]|uniref:Mutator family transposase n=1 Tax=Actinomadura pelletieri DSM 43383 TaxID=1120940 RepID=A0A495Q9U7_9ACTN|nr:mutator family transposase [Actinomadura pelletieri DSM 43383]
MRDNHVVQNKPAYIAVGIDTDGHKHVLGIWLARTPAATATATESWRFWTSVTTDLRNRGVRDILIACCDGLKGFEDAINTAFPATVVQTCVVHLIRNALRPVARKDTGAVAKQLKKVYTAVDADAPLEALAEFADTDLGRRYPQSVRVQGRLGPVHALLRLHPPGPPPALTTNGIESLNYQLRKVTKARGHFPTDDAVVSCCGWPSSTSRTNAPRNAPSNVTTATSTPSQQHASSRDNASPDGVKRSTNSPRPIPDASGRADFTIYLQGLSTPEVTSSRPFRAEVTVGELERCFRPDAKARAVVSDKRRPAPSSGARCSGARSGGWGRSSWTLR